ncbi:4'-phosphopantetheinyl transferase superfamily protein [Xanthomonas euroxanthea]|uniref:4'-phosphopantetheinyl transferase superfamily protein n=1 Tax=Xanthomonas euroxanthea TaxID=2259622 RepID=A0A8E4DZP5_9XANT|nr:4'-phosphopantetheinyl transferase superfamily protein [Xanthomonas euroxanthea]CAD1792182.1 4'-phosphopantetheinyl transferase superfamily protein [Xanthomonas euroxanthea]SYZ55754.1 4'-phosphopantetheinyl transferase sfp [Xanthomonas arboricola pv. juglandis]
MLIDPGSSLVRGGASDRMSLRRGLEDGEVHVWTTGTHDLERGILRDRASALLSTEEQARSHRFHFDADRDLYLLSRALLRGALSLYEEVAPVAWCFSFGEYGKPFLKANGDRTKPLSFNLSHAHGMAALVVARDRDVGIDVEFTSSAPPFCSMEVCFAQDEIQELERRVGRSREARFWALWTLRESYIKATGMGFSAPMKTFSMIIQDDDSVALIHNGQAARCGCWEFAQWTASDQHLLAVCARRLAAVPLRVRTFDVHPLLLDDADLGGAASITGAP